MGVVKKLTAVIMAVILMLGTTACSSEKSEKAEGTEATERNSQEEAVNITLSFPILSAVPADLEKVEAALTEIALAECNCTITLQPMAIGDYMTQASLMLSSGEDIGLMIHFDPITNYTTLVQKGQVQDITSLLETYAPEVLETVGEDYISASRVDGSLYGVPTMHDLATGYGVIMRTDLLEKYDIDVTGIATLEDLEPVFETIKENEPDIAPMFAGGASLYPMDAILKTSVDVLGDGYGVLMDRGTDKTVTNYFATAEYEYYVSTLYDWNQKGYMLIDGESVMDTHTTMFKADKIFAAFMTTKPGQVTQDQRNTGVDLTMVELSDPFTMTNLVNGIQWIVPTGASNPEKSVEVLRLLYTNEDFLNLLNYGIEGEHYVVTDNNQIALPEGVTADTSTFNWSIAYESGNEFLCYTWDTDDPDLWEQTQEYNDMAVKSAVMGFAFDSSSVAAEITALANVCSQYRVGLENGALDPAVYLEKFNSDLQDAGIDTVIAEKQSQLDEWLAENGN